MRSCCRRRGSWIFAIVALGCDPRLCADSGERARNLPAHLSETGLFVDVAGEQLASRVFAYAPEYALWSDGADKRRWLFVPEGERVDTSDAEVWRFPVGTKFWKEFAQDGVRVETRLLLKTAATDDAWAAGAYLWRSDRSDADLIVYGALNALGTQHNVPATGECFACHSGRSSGILGFSAVQLGRRSYEVAAERLRPDAAEALLSDPLPELDVPGTATERAALGYLHANCSHCHNQSAAATSGQKCLNPNERLSFDLDFGLPSHALADVAETATYRTAIGKVVQPGNVGSSKVFKLMSGRGAFEQMPPLGTERVDPQGLATIGDWIGAL